MTHQQSICAVICLWNLQRYLLTLKNNVHKATRQPPKPFATTGKSVLTLKLDKVHFNKVDYFPITALQKCFHTLRVQQLINNYIFNSLTNTTPFFFLNPFRVTFKCWGTSAKTSSFHHLSYSSCKQTVMGTRTCMSYYLQNSVGLTINLHICVDEQIQNNYNRVHYAAVFSTSIFL